MLPLPIARREWFCVKGSRKRALGKSAQIDCAANNFVHYSLIMKLQQIKMQAIVNYFTEQFGMKGYFATMPGLPTTQNTFAPFCIGIQIWPQAALYNDCFGQKYLGYTASVLALHLKL